MAVLQQEIILWETGEEVCHNTFSSRNTQVTFTNELYKLQLQRQLNLMLQQCLIFLTYIYMKFFDFENPCVLI